MSAGAGRSTSVWSGSIPGLRRHLIIVGAIAVVTAMAVVVQAELLANGLADLVQDGDVSGGLARMLILRSRAVAAVRAAGAGASEWSAARTMRAMRHDVRSAVLDHARADGDRTHRRTARAARP